MVEKCANTSSPPSCGQIKPNPLALLNHFTVPVVMHLHPFAQTSKTTLSNWQRPISTAGGYLPDAVTLNARRHAALNSMVTYRSL
jgi:hypothetical protein